MSKSRKILGRIVKISCICVIFFALGCLYIYRENVYALAYRWDLVPKNEQFTELYFDNAESLPQQTLKDLKITFSFTIHNVEGRQMEYPYVVYFLKPSGERITLAADTVTLADKEAKSISITHTFLASDQKGKVIVELTDLAQSIDFIVPNTNG